MTASSQTLKYFSNRKIFLAYYLLLVLGFWLRSTVVYIIQFFKNTISGGKEGGTNPSSSKYPSQCPSTQFFLQQKAEQQMSRYQIAKDPTPAAGTLPL